MKTKDAAIFEQAFDELEKEGYFKDLNAKIKRLRSFNNIIKRKSASTVIHHPISKSHSRFYKKKMSTTEIQIALLTEQINQLRTRCKRFKKDEANRRVLLTLIGKRRRLQKLINREESRELIK